MGSNSVEAAEKGGKEVQLAVLAATCSTAIVFFPVALLTGVSKYLFTALALAVVIALFCSYFVAMTVVPLFCSRFIKHTGHGNEHEAAQKDDPVPEHMRGGHGQKNIFAKIVYHFNQGFGWLQRDPLLLRQTRLGRHRIFCLRHPQLYLVSFSGSGLLSAHRSRPVCH
jgi:multidrug efflux pump subunit AcrB